MKERFEGEDNKRRLVDALNAQKLCAGAPTALGSDLADAVELVEVQPGEVIIHEGAGDDDLFFILAGKFSIHVKEQEIAVRTVGDCVGEMSAIESSLPRSATVVATELSVVAKLSEPKFNQIADAHNIMWRNISKVLAKRLHQRNNLVAQPNKHPKLFIISSVEALPIAYEIQASLKHDCLPVVWPDGVFFASGFPLEALEKAVDESDFAVAIAQPDDTATSRGVEGKVARDNVIFELGLFMGRLGRRRTILFQPAGQELRLPTDLKGLTAVSYQTGETKDMPAHIAAACHEVRKVIKELGVRKLIYGNQG